MQPVGERFGRWTVLEGWAVDSHRHRKWLCRCDCGAERLVCAMKLRNGKSRSCGCARPVPANAFKKGNVHGFKKGHIPANAFQRGRVPETAFKKGHVPANAEPIGTVSIWRVRLGDQRAYVKVDALTWRRRAVVVWEAHHGPVPPGHVIHHHNEDTLDDRIENLRCLTRAAHVALHNSLRAPSHSAALTAA